MGVFCQKSNFSFARIFSWESLVCVFCVMVAAALSRPINANRRGRFSGLGPLFLFRCLCTMCVPTFVYVRTLRKASKKELHNNHYFARCHQNKKSYRSCLQLAVVAAAICTGTQQWPNQWSRLLPPFLLLVYTNDLLLYVLTCPLEVGPFDFFFLPPLLVSVSSSDRINTVCT